MNRLTIVVPSAAALLGAALLAACSNETQPTERAESAPATTDTNHARAASSPDAAPAPAAPRAHRSPPAAHAVPESTIDPQVLRVDVPYSGHPYPPVIPDTSNHRDAWTRLDCLRCHETGVGSAPKIRHAGVTHLAADAQCRTCHVAVPGAAPRAHHHEADARFDPHAFPPMIPNSVYHEDAWSIENCLMCHEDGILGAPVVQHAGMTRDLLTIKCRTCHVQVRAIE